ncbi:hypothetical protein [Helicobacter typhlonius]|uniref:Uncharacterized protein n=1 Tax=Helicobacter typhlonius TaxID=76936 RepID=A0A0S4PVZ2_9HELI|nr:hypothetical protein [Helicobacter typhlonius]CUU40405.1 Hypothetical protein BN2458_PEG1522 [Helicobacter typhlonius]
MYILLPIKYERIAKSEVLCNEVMFFEIFNSHLEIRSEIFEARQK